MDHVLIEAVAASKAGQRHNLCNAHLFLLVEFPGLLEFSGIKVEGGPASSSHSFFQYGSGSIVRKLMEMGISRRCFAEWIIRMDQFGEMSKTKLVVHAEKSGRGASGKGRFGER